MARYNDPAQNQIATEYLKDRARKVKAEANMKEEQTIIERLKKEKLQKDLVPLKEVTETFMYIGARTKAQLLRLIGEIPPRVEGLEAAAIEIIIRDYIDEILNDLYTDFSITEPDATSTEYEVVEDIEIEEAL